MNATTYAEFRASGLSANQNDDRMDQVRELLFGEYQRQTESRLALIEARVREVELSLIRRLDDMEGRIEQLGSHSEAEQRAAFEELARGIADLGDRIRRIR